MAKRSRTPSIPAYFKERLSRVRTAIREAGCDALLITNPVDIRYLTPFSGEASCAYVTARSLTVISDARFLVELEELKGHARVVVRKGPMVPALVELLADRTEQRIGVQGESITLAIFESLKKGVGAKRLRSTGGIVAGVRLIKGDEEVRAISRAIKIQQDAFVEVADRIEPGWNESEVCAELEWEMATRGSEGPAFHTIVASKANAAKPHATPGSTKITTNAPLLIDWGATSGGYRGDLTRVLFFGKPSREMRTVYEVVREAHASAIDTVRDGARASDVDAVARGIIRDAGYGDRFGHALGHGIGLDTHEAPRIAGEVAGELRAGMVVTIEPGVYLPGVGGVRIEDDILVTLRGGRRLSSLPTDLEWACR
ncbi:MAG: aminopeptidase P family protein [Planctomycetota bacterium]